MTTLIINQYTQPTPDWWLRFMRAHPESDLAFVQMMHDKYDAVYHWRHNQARMLVFGSEASKSFFLLQWVDFKK